MNEGLGRNREAACGQRAQRWWSGHRRRKARCTHEAEACARRIWPRKRSGNLRLIADGWEIVDGPARRETGADRLLKLLIEMHACRTGWICGLVCEPAASAGTKPKGDKPKA